MKLLPIFFFSVIFQMSTKVKKNNIQVKLIFKYEMNCKCYPMAVIQALWNFKEEDCEFKVSLSYTARLCLKSTC